MPEGLPAARRAGIPRAAAFRRRIAAGLLAWAFAAVPAMAAPQLLPVGDSWEEYFRVLEVSGVLAPSSGGTIRPLGLDRFLAGLPDTALHPWAERVTRPRAIDVGGGVALTPTDPRLRFFWNDFRPYGPNEGAVWAGVGATAALDVGVTATWRRLTVALHPTIAIAENASYPLGPVTRVGAYEFAYPWNQIDLPQRFGLDPFWTLDPGQSSVRLDVGPATVGFGTENLWWGPGIRSALLMSNNASGFPHGLLETSRPLDVGIGRLEAQWIWGRLHQSEWFDTTFVDPGRFLTGAVFSYEPRWLPGLHLGVARVFYELEPESGVPFGDFFLVFQGIEKIGLVTDEYPEGTDQRDQMASFFFRWLLPGSGFELWAEWARNDHGLDFRDYFLQPEHAGARTAGLRKTLSTGGSRLLSLEAEITTLQKPRASTVREAPTYYSHPIVVPGYTQRGQVLGAWPGPGGSSQYVATRLFTPSGRAGVFLQRRVVDNDAYYARPGADYCCHHVFVDVGLDGLRYLGAFEVGASAMVTHEFNRYFVERSDRQNLSFRFEGRWRPR